MNLGYFFLSPAFITFPLLARLSAFLLAAHCPLFGQNLGTKKIGLTEEQAKFLVKIKESVPRSLNAQASLTMKDIEDIKAFSVQ